MILPALTILAISILAGCSDSITSSGESNINSTDKAAVTEVERQTDRPLYHSQIRIKPHKSYTFNQENTGLGRITSSDIKNISHQAEIEDSTDPCRSLLVYTRGKNIEKKINALSCHEEKLDVEEITVQNTSSSMIDVDVILLGTRPVIIIKNEE